MGNIQELFASLNIKKKDPQPIQPRTIYIVHKHGMSWEAYTDPEIAVKVATDCCGYISPCELIC